MGHESFMALKGVFIESGTRQVPPYGFGIGYAELL
jgi:hypothetical protein